MKTNLVTLLDIVADANFYLAFAIYVKIDDFFRSLRNIRHKISTMHFDVSHFSFAFSL